MATALVLQADGRRENGRWRRDSVDIHGSVNSRTWQQRLNECGVILDHAPHLAADVAQADGRRESGRWKYGAVQAAITESGKSTWRNLVNQCGVILDYAPHLAADVIVGSPNKRDVSFIVSGFVSSRFLYE